MPAATPNRRAFLIVFEGIDGSGSSTQTQRLTSFLRDQLGQRVVATKEPTTGPAGAMIRLALDKRLNGPNRDYHGVSDLEPASSELDYETMALLFAADRMDHLSGTILPSLQLGRHVVCDRYVLSSLAYQGLHLDINWLVEINRHIRPADLTFFLDVPIEHTQLRMKSTRLTAEMFEGLRQQELLRASYRKVIEAGYPVVGPVEIVDATKPIPIVEKQIQSLIHRHLLSRDLSISDELSLF